MKRQILAILLTGLCTITVLAQSGTSLYHLNNATFQGNHMNPAFFPEGKFFLGLPVISGIAIDLNSPISYNDLTTVNEAGQTEYDFEGLASNVKFRNYMSFESEINTLHLGFRPNKTFGFSFFVRERISANVYYAPDLIKMAWRGNESFRGESIDLNPSLADIRYYREYGIGIWKSIPKRGINIGLRVKYLNGMFAAITDRSFDGSVSIDEDYQHNFDLQGGVLNTSGFNLESSQMASHLIHNGNMGVGIDLGAHWKINEYFSAAVAVNDLGFIRWADDTENHIVEDTTFLYNGIGDLADIEDYGQALEDSLVARFVDTTKNEAFITGLNTITRGSVLFQMTQNDLFTGTISSHIVRNQFRMIYALGYTRKVGQNFTVSGNVSRIPQQGIDFGVGFAANMGPMQFYMASDKLVQVWNVPEISGVNLRFGINFVFGKRKEIKDDRSDLVHPSSFSKKEKVEKSDGIYWIIRRLKPRPIYEPPKNIRQDY